jgi:hypothetical protein
LLELIGFLFPGLIHKTLHGYCKPCAPLRCMGTKTPGFRSSPLRSLQVRSCESGIRPCSPSPHPCAIGLNRALVRGAGVSISPRRSFLSPSETFGLPPAASPRRARRERPC